MSLSELTDDFLNLKRASRGVIVLISRVYRDHMFTRKAVKYKQAAPIDHIDTEDLGVELIAKEVQKVLKLLAVVFRHRLHAVKRRGDP